MLYVIPIESYDQRYTEQWNRWFPAYLDSQNIPHRVIYGNTEIASLNEEDVLDLFGTHRYKYDQLSQIVSLIQSGEITDGDIIFFHTLWFTGIDSLQYIRQSLGINFKLVGVLHAGSYDPWDFRTRYGMRSWAIYLERSWLAFIDNILVSSKFHKSLILESINIPEEKIKVVRLPIVVAEILDGRKNKKKEDIVAFPHRNVPEKDPDIVNRLRQKLPNVKFVQTREICNTKQDFYDLLAKCKICISNSFQETFGYSVIEATVLGCIPLVPDRLCYSEMYPDEFRFQNESDLVEKIEYYLNNWSDPRESKSISKLIVECDNAVHDIIEVVLSCA
ncbi:hypothetical protein [Nostoc sp. ChiSLP03a]|uniref:hypothetical protein n=1 Tax=Nostoc sp. ChiSLP03a TaxID=3075380 RepID=UPI002AD3A8D6|nr:hypothetical protein [Nostoc sp. ChiSLP03a]